MMQERPATEVWLTLASVDEVESFDGLAQLAGLEPLGRGWSEVDEERVRRFLIGLLHRDLAYKSELMPEHRAEWLADEFLAAAGKYGSRFAIKARTCLMNSRSHGHRRRSTPSMLALP